MCKFTLQDKSHICFVIKSQKQKIVVNVDVVEKLSQMWYMFIPILSGAPELDVKLSRIPSAMLPAIENIHNISHMEYYELGCLPCLGGV
jgi:hypothetical protein